MLFVIYRTRQRRQIGLTILKAVPYPLTPIIGAKIIKNSLIS